MGLLDLFTKPNLDVIRKQGGMEKKYSSLISGILSLLEEFDENNRLVPNQRFKRLIKCVKKLILTPRGVSYLALSRPQSALVT
jgi:hypothetical protein